MLIKIKPITIHKHNISSGIGIFFLESTLFNGNFSPLNLH